MKLVLDPDVCQGYGLCQHAAPDLIDLDDDGYAELFGDGSVPGDQDGPAHQAAAMCPAQALKVQQ